MELADSYDTLDQIPAEHLALYVEKDGKHVLHLTGLKTQSDFDNYGKALRNRFAEQAARDAARDNDLPISGKDIKTMIADAVKVALPGDDKGGEGGDNNGNESQAVHDLTRKVAELTEKLEKADNEKTAAQETAQTTTINNALSAAAIKSGVRPEAVDSIVSLVSQNFEMSADGQVVVKLEGNKIPGATPNASPGDAFALVKRDAAYSYFWPDSKGGGGGNNNGGGGGGGGDKTNPWSKDGWNLTKQGEAVVADRANAETLAKAAGSHIGATKPAE